MPAGTQGKRTTAVRTGGTLEVSLQLGRPIRDLLEQEATVFGTGVTRAQLVRSLLQRKAGRLLVERPPHAPARRALRNAAKDRERLPVRLPPAEQAILLELCNRLGGGSKSVVVSHLLLDWCGISPLAENAPALSVIKRQRKNPSVSPARFYPVTLVAPIRDMLVAEVELMRLRGVTDMVTHILNDAFGLSVVMRSPQYPDVPMLRNAGHKKVVVNLSLPQVHWDALTEIADRLGVRERVTLISHFVLRYFGISPLAPDYVPAAEVPKPRGRRRSRA